MKALSYFSFTFFLVLATIPIFARQQDGSVPALHRVAAGTDMQVIERKDEFEMKSIDEKVGSNTAEFSSPLIIRP